MSFDLGVGQTASHLLGSVGTGLAGSSFFRLFDHGLVERLIQSLFKDMSRSNLG